MALLFSTDHKRIDGALALLRVVLGIIFIAHGAQKIFVYGLDGVAGGFGKMGIPFAEVMGPFVALVEFLGGLALVFGLMTRLAALGIAATMVVAILKVHLANGFFLPGGVEFTLALLAMAVAIVMTGAGRYSIDALVDRRHEPPVPRTDRDRERVRRVA
jgi:putative oxidoreductase